MIPLADHKQAVALAYQRAADYLNQQHRQMLIAKGRNPDDYQSEKSLLATAILALADTDPLAEVQELKRLAAAGNLIALEMREVEAEVQALKAERDKWEAASGTLIKRLTGRAQFCEDRGEVKTPELLRDAADEVARLREALEDMWAGWQYIRTTYGDLSGVGWDRCDEKARAVLQPKGPADV